MLQGKFSRRQTLRCLASMAFIRKYSGNQRIGGIYLSLWLSRKVFWKNLGVSICKISSVVQFSSLCRVQLFVTPWRAARKASLSFTISQNFLKLISIESVMLSNHLILCHPLLLLSSIFASIRVFSNESAFCIRWPKYWSFSFNISPSNEYNDKHTEIKIASPVIRMVQNKALWCHLRSPSG